MTGGLYRINTGSFSSLAGTVIAGDLVYVEVIASSLGGTATTAAITAGGVSGSFTVTTSATEATGPEQAPARPWVRESRSLDSVLLTEDSAGARLSVN